MKLMRGLNSLMQEMPFDSISVSGICSKADLSRQTFYRHFADKYDAVNWFNELFDQQSLIQIGRTFTWYEGHLKKLQLVLSEPDFFKSSLKSQGNYNSLIHFVVRYTEDEYRRTIVEYNGIDLTQTLDFQVKLWARIAAEIVTEWIFDDMKTPPEEMAALQDSCIPRELYEAMNEPVLTRRAQQTSANS
jgi:AcrR family transcriptional regulator